MTPEERAAEWAKDFGYDRTSEPVRGIATAIRAAVLEERGARARQCANAAAAESALPYDIRLTGVGMARQLAAAIRALVDP